MTAMTRSKPTRDGEQTAGDVMEQYLRLVEEGEVMPKVRLDAIGVTLRHLNMPCVVLGGDFSGATCFQCDLRGADLTGINRVRLVECQLTGACLPAEAELVDCEINDLYAIPRAEGQGRKSSRSSMVDSRLVGME